MVLIGVCHVCVKLPQWDVLISLVRIKTICSNNQGQSKEKRTFNYLCGSYLRANIKKKELPLGKPPCPQRQKRLKNILNTFLIVKVLVYKVWVFWDVVKCCAFLWLLYNTLYYLTVHKCKSKGFQLNTFYVWSLRKVTALLNKPVLNILHAKL